jgi:hypothetical protein
MSYCNIYGIFWNSTIKNYGKIGSKTNEKAKCKGKVGEKDKENNWNIAYLDS